MESKVITCEVAKADAALGVVFGWAAIDSRGGEDYFDSQGDHVPVGVIAKAFVDRGEQVVCKAEHGGGEVGRVVFAMPVYGGGEGDLVSKSGTVGMYVGCKFDDAEFAKFDSGEYRGFSIAGRAVLEEVGDAG